jgi:hypothetical protein
LGEILWNFEKQASILDEFFIQIIHIALFLSLLNEHWLPGTVFSYLISSFFFLILEMNDKSPISDKIVKWEDIHPRWMICMIYSYNMDDFSKFYKILTKIIFFRVLAHFSTSFSSLLHQMKLLGSFQHENWWRLQNHKSSTRTIFIWLPIKSV